MLVPLLAALTAFAPPIAPDRPVHLGIVLKLTHQSELDALRAAQQDPRSPDYHRWLTPAEFGRRFGQPPALVARTRAWLEAGGFEVTTYPNLSFLEAIGSARQVRALLAVQLLGVSGSSPAVHVPSGRASIPSWLSGQLVFVSGLDTRPHAHHRLYDSTGAAGLGPQDLRVEYDLGPVFDAGYTGQGQELVVMTEAEAPGNEVVPSDVAYFFGNLSDARVSLSERVLQNPDGDFDTEPGGRLEFELDPEMQSVGAPGAASIVLDVAPASQVFTLGAQDIANNLSEATAVSISLGDCEPDEGAGEVQTMRQAVIQGTAEGQTWTAASGDNGADDCLTGQGAATVDFPGVIPEIVDIGGSQIDPVTFDANAALAAYGTEEVWNDFEIFGGDAAGAGISTLFLSPSYQSSFGLAGRSVPDVSLIGGGPYTIAVTSRPGELDSIEGTSIGAPLAAGFFALIASGVGCRLGDPHTVLYDLGSMQYDGGGPAVFHDITNGDNSADGIDGYAAGTGFDTASGWGSMDVAALLKSWPACAADAGSSPGTPGPSYSACAFIGCDAGCFTLPEGPSTCDFEGCLPGDAGTCPVGTLCTSDGPYGGDGDGGVCITGCHTEADCIDGGVCDECIHLCVPSGNASAAIGDPCSSPDDCPPGSTCLLFTGDFDGGYCSADCDQGDSAACACPPQSTCYDYVTGQGYDLATCLEDCVDGGCRRPGYVCQPEGSGHSSCLPACTAGEGCDTCAIYSVSGTSCDVASGACLYPTATTGTSSSGGTSGSNSGGFTTGSTGAGETSTGGAGTSSTGGTSGTAGSTGSSTGSRGATTGEPEADGGTVSARSGGCSCSSDGRPDLTLALFGLGAARGLLRRRRPGSLNQSQARV